MPVTGTRYDVSNVPLQGGYVAKQCPVRAQNDTLKPGDPIPPDEFTLRLFANGNAFEAEVIDEILGAHSQAVVVEGQTPGSQEAATLLAMTAESSPILSGRLPADVLGRRVGMPDLLVTARTGGYRPVDIKWHQVLESRAGAGSAIPGLCSSLSEPTREAALIDEEYAARKKQEDLLQLAHYQRMLEAIGMAAKDGRWGAIIGTERRVVWYDLDAPIWRTASSTQPTQFRSTMERYDFEFAFRLDVIAVAERHQRDSSIALLTVPVKIGECGSCPWWDCCRPKLEQPPGDVSLLPRIGWSQWKIHRDHGVTNRAELAALDPRTARLVASGIDVAGLMSSDGELAELVGERALALLADEGIVTTGDLRELCALTASYSDAGMGALPNQIDLARAALGPEPVYRRRGVSQVVVPRADVEVDIDMESTELGCYLWGNYVTDRTGAGITRSGYIGFATWEPLSREIEAANSLRFWEWLTHLRAECHDAGLTFAAYCYNASAENTYLRRLRSAEHPQAEAIDTFIASDEWIDMLSVWDVQLITGHSSGLKLVAPLAGFRWDVEDPGGEDSMIKHDLAADGDQDARDWLLTYNRGDVEATLALREWMAQTALPGVEALDPH
jgi:predicted RecB family nuclease